MATVTKEYYGYIVDPLMPITDGSGNIIRGGYLKVFLAGSSTKVVTYKGWGVNPAVNSEEISIGADGRLATMVIALKTQSYKIMVLDSNHDEGTPVFVKDNIEINGTKITTSGDIVQGLNDVSNTDGQFNVEVQDNTLKINGAKTFADESNGVNKIKNLGTTATEADLVAGNYFVLDGAGGTKKLGAENVAKGSDVKELESKIENIEIEYDSSERECISIQNSEGEVILEITESLCDLKNLKSNGKDVETKKEWIEEENCGSGDSVEITDNYGNTILKIDENGIIDSDGNSASTIDSVICNFDKSLFGEEAKSTISKVNSLKNASEENFVLTILTDSHHQPEKEQISTIKTLNTFRNIYRVCWNVKVDGIIHLGDFLSSDDKYWYDNSVINREIDFLRKNLSYSSKKTYFIVGNHDGIKGSVPTTDNGYDILLNTPVIRCYGADGKPKPYYYFKDENKKIIGLCLALPFKEDGKTNSWSFSSYQLEFFVAALSNVGNDYHIFVFCHLNEYNYLVNNDIHLKSFSKVLDAFNSHSSYSDSNVSVDFTTKIGTKVVAWVCGHLHADAIYMKNDWVDCDNGDNISQNTHDFPIIMIGSSCYSGTAERIISKQGHNVSIVPRRVDSEKCVDLWDVMVYQKSLNKLCFVRFGASAANYQVDSDGDRVINL